MKVGNMRIGLVGPLPPPSGGMANQTLQLATLLRAEGATVDIIQVNRPYHPTWIGRFQGVRALFRLVPYISELWRSADHVDLFHVMANSGWSWHLFSAPALWVAKLKGKPVVINYRGGEADAFLRKSRFLVRLSLVHADAIIVPSGFLRAVFGKYGFSTEVVPNIIDLSRFSAVESNRTSQQTGTCVLIARNLEPIYDIGTALQALIIVKQQHPALSVIIAGSGPERASLQELADELGLGNAVTFTGRVDNKDMPDLYRKANLVVNPSLVDNMPNSILEALASGIPVVSTDVGGVPYIVEHKKTAMLVPPQDPKAMATAILSLLNDSVKADQIRKAGMQSVQDYTWQKVGGLLLDVYERAITKAPNTMVEAK